MIDFALVAGRSCLKIGTVSVYDSMTNRCLSVDVSLEKLTDLILSKAKNGRG